MARSVGHDWLAWRNRLISAGCVAAFLLLTHLLCGDPAQRARTQYRFVITLGYGHLIGALALSARRLARCLPSGVPPALLAAFAGASGLTLFAGYAWLSARAPSSLLPLLAISTWHVVENDLALARAACTQQPLGPLARALPDHLAAALATLVLLVLAAATLGGPGFGDVFSAVTLYHLVQWLVFLAARARSAGVAARRALWRRLARVHGLPAIVCLGVLALDDARAAALRHALFSPSLYLFWSVLHVLQTALARERGARGPLG